MAQSDYDVFIVHHGWRETADDPKVVCMKMIALQIRDALHKAPKVPTFVDEADMAPGTHASYYLKQKLIDCEVGATTTCGSDLMQQGFLTLQISSSIVTVCLVQQRQHASTIGHISPAEGGGTTL